MHMPGFNADASLYRTSRHFRMIGALRQTVGITSHRPNSHYRTIGHAEAIIPQFFQCGYCLLQQCTCTGQQYCCRNTPDGRICGWQSCSQNHLP